MHSDFLNDFPPGEREVEEGGHQIDHRNSAKGRGKHCLLEEQERMQTAMDLEGFVNIHSCFLLKSKRVFLWMKELLKDYLECVTISRNHVYSSMDILH